MESLRATLAQLDPTELPPAIQWLVYFVLLAAAVALLKRSVDKLDKTIERLDTAVTSITEKLIRHDERIKKLEEAKPNGNTKRRS